MIRTLALTLAALGAVAQPALAQKNTRQADELFREGRRLMATGRLDEACAKFAESNQAEASVGALLNLGECEIKRQDLAAAWSAFRRAELLARATRDAERARFAKTRMDKVGESLGFVTIAIAAEWRDAPGVEVSIDGKPLVAAEVGPPLPLEPGVHEVTAAVTGAKPFRRSIDIQLGVGAIAIEVRFEKAEPAYGGGGGDGGGDTAGPRNTQRIVGISMTAAGAVALGLSITLGGVARSQWNDVKACRDRPAPPCSLAEIDRGNSARTKADVATGFFVAGAIVAGAGIAVWVTSDDKSKALESGPGVSLAPAVAPDRVGVLATGRF